MSPSETTTQVLTSDSATRGERLRRSAAFSLFLAALFSLHIVPRSAPPYLFPLPRVESGALNRVMSAQRELLRAHGTKPLAHEVRVIGEEVRREGLSIQTDLKRDVQVALRSGLGNELKLLRALQTKYFVQAAITQDYSKPATRELLELGGDFHSVAKMSWVRNSALLLNEDELGLLFQIRWAKLTDTLSDPELGISLTEFRIYFSTMLRYPPLALNASGGELALARDSVVTAASALDPEYPVGLARALNLLAEGQPEMAQLALDGEARSGRPASHSLRLRHHHVMAKKMLEAP